MPLHGHSEISDYLCRVLDPLLDAYPLISSRLTPQTVQSRVLKAAEGIRCWGMSASSASGLRQ